MIGRHKVTDSGQSDNRQLTDPRNLAISVTFQSLPARLGAGSAAPPGGTP